MTVALAVPFVMILRHVFRSIKVAFNNADADVLEDEETLFDWWLYFIYDKAPEAVGYAQSLLEKCVGVGNNPPPAVGTNPLPAYETSCFFNRDEISL
jgi:hypothetical protein